MDLDFCYCSAPVAALGLPPDVRSPVPLRVTAVLTLRLPELPKLAQTHPQSPPNFPKRQSEGGGGWGWGTVEGEGRGCGGEAGASDMQPRSSVSLWSNS